MNLCSDGFACVSASGDCGMVCIEIIRPIPIICFDDAGGTYNIGEEFTTGDRCNTWYVVFMCVDTYVHVSTFPVAVFVVSLGGGGGGGGGAGKLSPITVT